MLSFFKLPNYDDDVMMASTAVMTVIVMTTKDLNGIILVAHGSCQGPLGILTSIICF